MRNIVNTYGMNAGKVWGTLEHNGSLTANKIMNATKLKENDFYVAVGWLVKENKICKTGTRYNLGETNLKVNVGKNAGKIWETLEQMGDVDAPYLPRLAGITPKDAYSAVGWLAKEGKINAKAVKPKTPQLKFAVKY